jgi:hypothetical protein
MGHWEIIDGELYWFDEDDLCVPLEFMEDRDWLDAIGIGNEE